VHHHQPDFERITPVHYEQAGRGVEFASYQDGSVLDARCKDLVAKRLLTEFSEPIQRENGNSRSRSNTATSNKSRKRPLSRASTTSAHSGPTHSMPPQQHVAHPTVYPRQWYDQNAHNQQRFDGAPHQMSAEEILMHSATQLQNPRQYEVDPAIHVQQQAQAMNFHGHGHYQPEPARQSLPADFSAVYTDDVNVLEARSENEQDEGETMAGANAQSKKGAKSSAANELEMRQLYQSNKHRTLPDVAQDLHGNERGPQSERQRQVFAMIWSVPLSLTCKH
jgi:regulatory factor X